MQQEKHPYNVIVGRHIPVTEEIRNYITKKLQKLEKLADNIIDIYVTLDVQKISNTVDILMHFGHFTVKVAAAADDMYVAIDKAVSKLQHLIGRYKEKMKEHHAKGHAEVNMDLEVLAKPNELDLINEEIESENARLDRERYALHTVVRKEKKKLKTLLREEAIIKMELSSEPFMVYKSEEDQKIKVIYRMPDDNYGILEVQ